jgi:hypothetical protein
MSILADVADIKRRLLLEIAAAAAAEFAAPSLHRLTAEDIPDALQKVPFVLLARGGAVATHDLLTVQLPENVARASEQIRDFRETAHGLVTSFCDELDAALGGLYKAKGQALQESLVERDKVLESILADSSIALEASEIIVPRLYPLPFHYIVV